MATFFKYLTGTSMVILPVVTTASTLYINKRERRIQKKLDLVTAQLEKLYCPLGKVS